MYDISTAKNGAGNLKDSFQTPLGKHTIYAKIGEDMPKNTFFVGRQPKGVLTEKNQMQGKDWILSRILWLQGAQPGINKYGRCDTRQRYIYIHGTHEEALIGQPASHGCIRMKNDDVMQLFDHVRCGEKVLIKP